MPCVEWFDAQDRLTGTRCCPPAVRGAGHRRGRYRQPWCRFAGDAGEIVSIEHFGASADFKTLFREFGITAEAVVAAARRSARKTLKGKPHDTDKLAALAAAGSPSGWTTCPGTASQSGNLPTSSRQACRRGHHEPDDLPGRLSDGPPTSADRGTRRPRRGRRRRVRTITTDDVRDACDVFAGRRLTNGVDGRVSIEVDPRLAHDTEKTIAQAGRTVQNRRPAEPAHQDPGHRRGPARDHRVIAEGISVNVTLIFSVDRYRAVMDAYLDGLEQAKKADGHDPQDPFGRLFFVSRVDLEIDKRLKTIGTAETLGPGGKAGDCQRPAGLPGVRADLRR